MVESLFSSFENNYMPHGHCYFWEPYILWSHALSDSIIALAYMTIPLSLVKIVRGRREDDFAYMWMLVLFALFILGCGATHVMDVVNIWEPWYYTDSAIRIITALASIGTAIMLVKVTPQLIMLPSARRWQQMNSELKSLNDSLEQKVQERTRELEQMAERYKFMTNAIPQIVWTANARGEVDFFNDNWYAYTGLTEPESLLSGWGKVIHPQDLAAVVEQWSNSIAGGTPFEAKFRMKNVEEEYYWHLGRGIPMTDASGAVSQWFGTVTNIHEQVEKQEELQRINEDLDNFVYTASHDLKTPILNIEGLLTLLHSKAPAGERTDLGNIYSRMDLSVQKLKDTIHDLADISRIQRESADELHWIVLPELIEEFKVNSLMEYEASGARIETDLEEEEICCMSRKHMRSLLDNLLGNALKYRHPDRTPHIQVRTRLQGEEYSISVQDNGIGISPEHQPRVFDMFRRFHLQATGTGVGLYIVKKIVDKYAGRIELQSTPGQGSTFTVWLKKRS
ncbi:sensor histidine kinase [Cesiribacter andamanensis]|uniref:histidine kinase n=1 Tax=Cesiribacter andamanensis AMV16 TaxID=1279009 RepID=M7NHZ7_9BACT|nr:PAS domain-containing sensor histidine kinase [Cesiribacter andamanensis]EMR01440.1 Phytochrome-like protein cph1 [Cesiribacter andamanensis AMV16]